MLRLESLANLSKTTYGKQLIVALITAFVIMLFARLNLNLEQILAVAIFTYTIMCIVMFWEQKIAYAILGVVLLFLSGTLTVEDFIKFAYIDVIFFLMGMMLVVRYLEERGFFEYLIWHLSKGVKSAYKLISILAILAAVFSSVIGVVMSVLFMIPIILKLASKYKVNPKPLIFIVTFAANIGSSATVIGNPVGIVLAFKARLSFYEFIRWATPISMTSVLSTLFLSLKVFSKDIKLLDQKLKTTGSLRQEELKTINRADLLKCCLLLLLVTFLICFHSTIESILGLEKESLLLTSSLIGASIVLLSEHRRVRTFIERGVDWYTLTFFAFLFASVGALENTGITEVLAENVSKICGGSILQLLVTMTLLCGMISALLDNVVTVALFASIIHHLASLGYNVYPLWWGILFGATFFGNATLIASTANIVAVGILEARKLGTISFFEWLKYGIIASFFSLSVALLLLYIQLPLML